MALLSCVRLRVKGVEHVKEETAMSSVNVNIDPATRAGDEAAVKCEPGGHSASPPSRDNQRPDLAIEDEDSTPEEAGYGYGV